MGAGSFAIFTAFRAKDGVSPAFKSMTRGAGDFQNRLNRLGASGNAFGSCVKGITNKLNMMSNAFMGLFAISKIKSVFDTTTEAAEKELAAQLKLTQALKNNAAIRARGSNAYKEVAEDLFKTASDIQKKGILGDEALVGGMQALGAMGFDDKIIKKMIPVIGDLTVQQKGYKATLEDVENTAKGLGRALSGNAGALSRMNIVLDKNQKKMLTNMQPAQRAEYIYKLLSQRVGGLNEAMAKTDRGAKIQWLNNWGDRMEDIGKRIIPLEGGMYRLFNTFNPQIESAIQKFFNGIEYAIKAMSPVWDAFKESFSYLGEHLVPELSSKSPLLKEFFEGVFVPGVKLTIEAITGLFKIIVKTYNFIKDYWVPILSVIAGVGGMLAVKKAFDVTRAAITWYNTSLMVSGANGIAVLSGFQKLTFVLGGYASAIWKSVTAIWAQTKALLANPWTWVAVGIAAVVAGAILIWKNWDKITAVMSNWWNNTVAWLSGFWNKCLDVFGKIGNFIKTHFIDILFMALGPIGLVLKGLGKIGETLGFIKSNSSGDKVSNNNSNPTYNSPATSGNKFNGNLNVGVTIDNNTAFPATSSLNLTGNHSMNLVPAT